MLNHEIIRAWKDTEYRASLSEAALARLPGHPAGWIGLADPGLARGAGLSRGLRVQTAIRGGIFDTMLECHSVTEADGGSCLV